MRRIHMSLLVPLALCMACAGTSISEDPSVEPAGASTAEAAPQDSEAEVPTEEEGDHSDTSAAENTEVDEVDDGDANDTESADERLPSTGDEHRDAAQNFALDIIQTYFDNDAETWESYVHAPIYLAGTNTVHERSEYTEMMLDATHFPAGHDLIAYSMADYLRVYDAGVYTFTEASENFGLPLFDEDGWVPEDDEFIFVGFFRSEGVPYTEEFMPVGLVLFVVGKRDGAWKIIGLVPDP